MTLLGSLDTAERERIGGWAWDSDRPDLPVSLVITANNEVVGRVRATQLRPDVAAQGFGDGRAGFNVWLAKRLSPLVRYVISVRREGDGAHLDGSPVTLEASTDFDQTMRENIERMLDAVTGDIDVEDRLAFLAAQTRLLLRRHSRGRGWVNEREARRALAWQAETGTTDIRPRALVIDDCVPKTNHETGSDAVFSHMQSLQRLGFDVSFVPADMNEAYHGLEAIGVACHSTPWYDSVEAVLSRNRDAFTLVYLRRLANAVRYPALVRAYQPRARLIFSLGNLRSLGLARQAEIEQRPELLAQSKRVRTQETMAAWWADAVVTHSDAEAALLGKGNPMAQIRVVPWAVPLRPTSAPFAERNGFAFIGSYREPSNVDAARWLLEAVMPKVRALDPSIRCFLSGNDLPPNLRRMTGGNVEVVDAVTDLSSIFERIRLTVMPLAYGAGVTGAVLDSMAAGIPCACTPVAAEGLDLPTPLSEQVAASPAEIAARICRLHEDEALNESCRQASLAYVGEHASEANVDSLLGKAVMRGGSSRP